MRYADYIPQTLAPISLQGPNGAKWFTGLGEEKDFLKQRVIDSVALRFPTYAPADSLLQHGIDRQIERAPGEADASYRRRLLKAHATWKWSGTDYGIMLSFEAIGWHITHVDPFDSWPAEWPYDTATVQTHTWLGPGDSVAGTPVEVASQFTVFWKVYGESFPGQLSGLTITGDTPLNTDDGRVYLSVFEASDVLVYVYSDEARTVEVAFGMLNSSFYATGGDVVLSELNGSGLSGTVHVGPSIQSDVTPYAQIASVATGDGVCAVATSSGLYVLDSGVSPGGPVRVATKTSVWILPTSAWGALPAAGYGFAAEWPVLDYHEEVTTVRYLPFSAGGYAGAGPGALVTTTRNITATGVVTRGTGTGPSARAFPAVCTWGENVVLYGGMDGAGQPLDDCWVWDSQHDDWHQIFPSVANNPMIGACMAALAGKPHFFGGLYGVVPQDMLLRLDGDAWTTLANSSQGGPPGSYHGCMAELNGCLYHFGGTVDGLNAIPAVSRKWDGSAWTKVVTAHTPPKRFGHTIARVGDVLVLFGGRDGATIYDDWWTFDGVDWTWHENLTGYGTYWHGAAAISDHELLVWGGLSNDKVFVLNLTTGLLTNGTSLPEASWGFGGTGILEKVTRHRLGLGTHIDGSYVMGTALPTSERDAMIASIRKWKSGELTVPEMLFIASDGGFADCLGPVSVLGGGAILGGNVVRISVGE